MFDVLVALLQLLILCHVLRRYVSDTAHHLARVKLSRVDRDWLPAALGRHLDFVLVVTDVLTLLDRVVNYN